MSHVLDRDQAADAQAVSSPRSDAPPWASICLNCSSPLNGPFCSHCGQRALPPHPTIRQLAGDAYDELAGWDGKFAATVRILLRRPGELTRILLEGQRTTYISPVRLYLLCSLLYFVVAAAIPLPDTNVDFEAGFGFGISAEPQTAADVAMSKAVASGLASLTAEERAAIDAEIATMPSVFRPIVYALIQDYAGFSRRVTETIPRALFVLIPALALILGIFYRGRSYPDHLYFAIHFQTFVFVVLTASALLQFSRSLPLIAVAQIGAALWILVYGVFAQRRVYGGSWPATGLKAVGIAVLYGSLWSAVTIAVTLWVSRAN